MVATTKLYSKSPEDAHPILIAAFNAAKVAFEAANAGYTVKLDYTYRSPQMQDCLYMQGRLALSVVNAERAKLHLPPLVASDNKVVTSLKGGQSKHNAYPSRAIDIALFQGKKYVSTDLELYRKFAICMEEASDKVNQGTRLVSCGAFFISNKDYPHFELREVRLKDLGLNT